MPSRFLKYVHRHIRSSIWIALIAIYSIASSAVYAQGPADGTQSLFIETGMGARAQGFGNAFVATANDGSAVFWNPAGLDYLTQSNLVLFHSTLIEGSFYNFASVTFPFVQFGSVGVGVARIGVDGIDFNNRYITIASNQTFAKEEYYFSYGKKLPWFGLALGTTFKVDHTSRPI